MHRATFIQPLGNLMTDKRKENPMSELNYLNRQQRSMTQGRVVAWSTVLVMALLTSLTWTVNACPSCRQAMNGSAALLSAGGAHSVAGQLVISISDAGMTPASATVSGGIVHLRIENSSGQAAITLRLNREGGSLVREIIIPEGTRELSTEVELGGGQYVLAEASHSSWTCALTVQ
jgi:hypothetical protein